MSNPVVPYELQAKIASWRQRMADGTITKEEMKEAVQMLRAGRMAAATSPAAAKRKKAIAEIPPAADMLNDLAGM